MTRSRHRGFTLIELIIFIVVVSAGLAGILSVMNTVVKSSADPMVRKQSIAIAESLLEEILLKNYNDPDAVSTVVIRLVSRLRRLYEIGIFISSYPIRRSPTAILIVAARQVGKIEAVAPTRMAAESCRTVVVVVT